MATSPWIKIKIRRKILYSEKFGIAGRKRAGMLFDRRLCVKGLENLYDTIMEQK
jgi:hypothetical protein